MSWCQKLDTAICVVKVAYVTYIDEQCSQQKNSKGEEDVVERAVIAAGEKIGYAKLRPKQSEATTTFQRRQID